MDFTELTAPELRCLLQKKEITAREVTIFFLQRCKEINPKLNAYLALFEEEALKQAQMVDRKIKEKEPLGLLAGIPLAIKDNICLKDFVTSCASKILENFYSPYNATVIDRIRTQDAIILGKTNMDEFAMGSSNENSYFGPVRNPWDLSKVPGGSSGGSAAVVASDLALAALGSDTGGSIRQPASFCGVVGLKPTYGRVSRYGLVAFASSLDQIGPISKNVKDCALLLQVIAGQDVNDSTSVNLAVPDFLSCLDGNIRGLKIGVPKEYFSATGREGIEPDVERAVKKAILDLESLGVRVEEISLPHTEYAIAVYYLVATAEASSNLARYDGVRYGYRSSNHTNLLEMYKNSRSEGFGTEVKRRIMLGTYALSSGYYEAYYQKAQQVRALIRKDFEEAFKKVDCLVTPTSPTVAFKFGERVEDPLSMYLADVFTVSVNLAGLPAISIPCGFSENELPVGWQIIGKLFDEETVLKVAYAYEQTTEWHKKKTCGLGI
ncbi:MAG: Asp-tRNA(Asn)/Glu-tRNA(Gln) amidotransferase subunit GatA [Candidatus Edwardsbacteria bacterium]